MSQRPGRTTETSGPLSEITVREIRRQQTLDRIAESAPPVPLSREQEVETFIILKVRSFGKPEQVKAELELSVARAVHHGGIQNFEIATPHPNDGWVVRSWKASTPHTFDPKGDDQGHHPGHDVPLVPTDSWQEMLDETAHIPPENGEG